MDFSYNLLHTPKKKKKDTETNIKHFSFEFCFG